MLERLTAAAAPRRPRWTAEAAAALLYVACALLFTYPLWLSAGTHIAYKPGGDQLFVLSLLEWMRLALFSQPGDFFTGNFYFGSGEALYRSHLMLGYLPIYGPLAWVTQNPVLAYSLTHVAAFVLNAGAMYATVLTLTRSRPGALLAGAVYAFGPLQLAYANHFQFLGAWWLPLVLLFGIRVWRGGGWVDFGLATLMVWVQFTTNAHLGVLAGMVYAAFVAAPAVHRIAKERDVRRALAMLAAGAAVTAPFIPILHGYLAFSDTWRASRDITEVQFWSAQLQDYMSPTGRLRWHDALAERFPVPSGERRVFPGFVPTLFAAIGLGAGLLGRRATGRGLRIVTVALLALVATGVLFSLGTHWKTGEIVSDIQLPYLWLFEHTPVFEGIRVVARFSLLAHFAIAVLAGIGMCAITRRTPRWSLAAPLAGALAGALVLVEAAPKPLAVFPIPTDPSLRAALRETTTGPMIFVPVSGKDEVWRMWIITETGAGPMVNGYSGHIWKQTWYFRDATQTPLVNELAGLAAGLQAYGLRTVVVDLAQFGGRERGLWEAFAAGPWVADVNRVEQRLIITLTDPAAPAAEQWADLDATLLVDAVEPSVGFVGALVLHNANATPWTPPGDSRVRRMLVEWVRADGSVEWVHAPDVLPPPFLRPGQIHATQMHVATPQTPGSYLLRVSTDGERLLERPVRVATVAAKPFDGSVDNMRAFLALRTPASLTLPPAGLAALRVDALNTGQTSWGDAANIRLGWRMFAIDGEGGETELPEHKGRVVLLGHEFADIPPGRGYAFAGQLRAPDEPGRYVVRVSMLSELLAWFNIDPIEIEVTVTGPDQ